MLNGNLLKIERIISLISLIFLQAGCIREDLESCPASITTNLYITVQEKGEVPENVTQVDRAILYLFDRNGAYDRQIGLSEVEISGQLPVSVSYEPDNIPYAIVWGNIKERTVVSDFAPGTSMEQIILSLEQESDGYSQQPDDLFFGMKRLNGTEKEEVIILPKTGRINITVKGLPDNKQGESYYFSANSQYSSYNLMGTPVYGSSNMRLMASFNKQHDLVTPQSYNLIHYPLSAAKLAVNDNEALRLELYKKIPGESEDNLLISANKDQAGNYLIPQPGKTMNVLIYFTQNGNAEVTVMITAWDEVYQWTEW